MVGVTGLEPATPCIVGTGHASRSLRNGVNIKLDLDLGIVEIV